MPLNGIHHITAITADAQTNLDFYAGLLGLRFVKKTVNFDDPTAYHLYYGDDRGHPGSILTFFEYPGTPPGQAGRGMIHRISWRVADTRALAFWEQRLAAAGVPLTRGDGWLRFTDPEGLELELDVTSTTEAPLVAAAPGIPARHALLGFNGVRAFTSDPERSRPALEQTLEFAPASGAESRAWRIAGGGRSSLYAYDPAPPHAALQGAGTVHHIAWAVPDDEQLAWRQRLVEAYLFPTLVIDRTYFRSVYFREPSGVLFEIATLSPGFAVDEPWEQLGEGLRLPPQHEHLRAYLERTLAPLSAPSQERAA